MNRRLTAVLAIGALIAAGAAATADAASAATPQRLLHRYQPVTQLDPLEQFVPATVLGFVGDSVLETRPPGGTWSVADPNPTIATLPRAPGIAYRLNQATCSPEGGVSAIPCYSAAEQASGVTPAVYGRIAYRPHRLVLQYWYFYYDDVYSYDYPPDDLFWQAHEGDWESVNVVLDRATRRPLFAGYSQHCMGERRPWSQVERVGRHPVDHVAIGSHANLLDPGDQAVPVACIPPEALQILQASGLPAPVDRSGAGPSYGPGTVSGLIPQVLLPIGRRVTPWAAFSGTWGEDQLFHPPEPIGTVTPRNPPASPRRTAP